MLNVGPEAVDDPDVVLRMGRGAEPTGTMASPVIGRLEPGETTTVVVDVELPRGVEKFEILEVDFFDG